MANRIVAQGVRALTGLRAASRTPAVTATALRCSTVAVSRAPTAMAAAAVRVRPAALSTTTMRHFHATSSARDDGEEIVVNFPQAGESIVEGGLEGFEKEVGDYVEQDEVVASIETDKTVVGVQAPVAGTVTELLAEPGDTVLVGAPIFKMTAGGEAPPTPPKEVEKPAAAAEPAAAEPAAAPPPSAPAAAAAVPPTPAPVAAAAAAPAADIELPPGLTKVKMTRMRLRTAERLKEAQNTAAMLTTFNEVDMTNLIAYRAEHKERVLKEHGVKLGFMSRFAAASAWALRHEPAVNGHIAPDGQHIIYNDDVNISVAVATPKGLVVPVLRKVQDMSYIDIEREIAALGEKARAGDLAIEDMDGGTFTISNGGVFGSLMGTPILNAPQSAILGMHGIFPRPVAVTNPETGVEEVQIRKMMYLALTYDHRLIDGREAVTTLRRIKQAVEDHDCMLLE